MSILDDIDDLLDLGPFESHARLYMDRGWHPFPLPFKCKKPPAVGFTGDAGVDADAAQIDVWLRTKRRSNIGLRVGSLCVGIDVDNYDGKKGGATLADLEAELGPLPATWITTSRRDDDVSGIRYFRLPEARKLITELNGIEIVQRHHRYACAPPSLYPETLHLYWWLGPDGTWSMVPPHVDDLPMLPDAWFEFLTNNEAAQSETRAKAKKAARIPGPINGNRSQAVDDAVRYAIAELDNGSRHGAMVAGAMALARLEESGHPGTDGAIVDLRTEFIKAIGDDRKYADQEFDKAIRSARHKAATTAATRPRWEDLPHGHPPDVTDVAASTLAPHGINPETGEVSTEPPTTIPAGAYDLFDASELLRHIERFARARRASPWATLGAVLVRTACAVEPFVVLPPLVGGDASLNIFVALVGPSGSGKGAAEAAGRDAIDLGQLQEEGVGSGEGIGHAYMRFMPAKEGAPAGWDQYRTRLLLRAPEVDTLGALAKRSSSTLLPKLRDAYIGDDLSFAYADATKKVPLRAHTYRLGLIVGVQPERAGTLLDDSDGGTPQRFLWLPTRDPDVPDTAPPEPPRWTAWKTQAWPASTGGRVRLDVCPEARAAVEAATLARHRGQVAALDGHALLARLKSAAALAILHGETEVSSNAWEMSGHVQAVSDACRSAVTATSRSRQRVANLVRAEAEAERKIITGDREALARRRRIVAHLEGKLAGGDWLASSALRKTLRSEDRDDFDSAIEALIETSRIEVEATDTRGQSGRRFRRLGGPT